MATPAGDKGRELRQRIAAALILAPLALAAAWIGGAFFALLVALVACVVLAEWNTVARAGRRDGAFWAAMAILLLVSAIAQSRADAALAVLGAGAALCAWLAWTHRGLWLAGGLVYAAALALAAPILRGESEAGLLATAWLFVVVWASDSGAYMVGRTLGGPKLWPRVSPAKTWSGALGGLAVAVLASLAFAASAGLSGWWPLAVLALAGSVLAQVGDLAESAFKRHFKVKDISRLIPGHGGMMDRVDGLLLAAAVLCLFALARGGGEAPAGLILW